MGSTVSEPRRTISRRQLLRTGAALGVGGLAFGGVGGYLLNDVVHPSGGGGGPSGGPSLKVVGINALALNPSSSEETRNGTQLAVDEINARGGVLGRKLEYSEVDYGNAGDPAQVRDGFTRAIETHSPDVIIAMGPNAMGPDLDTTAAAGVIYINGNTREEWRTIYDKDPAKYWNVFQYDPAETAYGNGFAVYIDSLVNSGVFKPHEKSVAIIAGDDSQATNLGDVFQKKVTSLGWRLTDRQPVTIGTTIDWGPIFSKIRQDPPALLFTADYALSDCASMVQAFVAAPMKGTLIYQWYAPSEPAFLDLAKDAANGIIWSTVLGVQVDAFGESFRTRYQAKFGKQPGWSYAGGCYDATYLWARAVAMVGDTKDSRKIAKTIEENPYRGVTGSLYMPRHICSAYPAETLDASLGQPTLVVQIQNGKQKVIGPAPFTNGEFAAPPYFA